MENIINFDSAFPLIVKFFILPMFLFALIYVVNIFFKFKLNSETKALNTILFFVKLIGTPLHEISHFITARIVGFPVESIELLNFNLKKNYAGRVLISFPIFNPFNILSYIYCAAMYIVGLSPLLFFSVFIFSLSYLMHPEIITIFMGNIQSSDASFEFYLLFIINWFKVFLSIVCQSGLAFIPFIILVSISLHILPSPADLRIAIKGFLILAIPFSVMVLISSNGVAQNLIMSVANVWLFINLGMLICLMFCVLMKIVVIFLILMEKVIVRNFASKKGEVDKI